MRLDMSGYRDELRAAHDRIATLQRELDETRRTAEQGTERSRQRVEQLERQVERLESDDAGRAQQKRIEELEQTLSDERATAKRDLDNATMRILQLEEKQHQHAVDYDRAFARAKELETQLQAVQREREVDAERRSSVEDVDARIRSLEEQVRARDEELTESRHKVKAAERRARELRDAHRNLEQQLEAAREAAKESRKGNDEPASETAALVPVRSQDADPDLVRLSPAGSDWAVVYRVPIAARPFKHKSFLALGTLVLVTAIPVGLSDLNVGWVVAIVGVLLLVVGWWRSPSVHRVDVGDVWRQRDEHEELVTTIEARGRRFPAAREHSLSVAKGQPMVLEVDGWTGDVLVALARVDTVGEVQFPKI